MHNLANINGDRLLKRIADFAQIGATAKGGVNRQALSLDDRRARCLLSRLAHERGFKVFQDKMANLFIRREGRDADAAPILIGSHLDSQITGGKFDGALGTLAAFEVLETLEDEGIETDLPVELVAWTNEEGSRFSPGTMGSMCFAAGEIPADWSAKVGFDGGNFADELAATLDALSDAEMRPLGFPISAYLEVHIEQGPELEREGLPIAIVHGIQGTRWLEVTLEGQAAHAGTTSLAFRRDPFCAMVEALQPLQASIMQEDALARFTVGRVTVEPGAVNAIPSKVVLSLDMRHPLSAGIDAIEDRARVAFEKAALAHGCEISFCQLFDMAPAEFPDWLLDSLDESARRLGYQPKRMLSGAFHDALFVNRVAPSAMIFVPCRDGLSHNEAEYVEPQDCVHGARMLLASTLGAIDALIERQIL